MGKNKFFSTFLFSLVTKKYSNHYLEIFFIIFFNFENLNRCLLTNERQKQKIVELGARPRPDHLFQMQNHPIFSRFYGHLT